MKNCQLVIKFILNIMIGLAILVVTGCVVSGLVNYISVHFPVVGVYLVIGIILITLKRLEKND